MFLEMCFLFFLYYSLVWNRCSLWIVVYNCGYSVFVVVKKIEIKVFIKEVNYVRIWFWFYVVI